MTPVVSSVVLPSHASTSCDPTVVQIPANTSVNTNNFSGVDLNYWFCTPGVYANTGGLRLMVFIESGVTINIAGSNSNTFYVQSGGVLTINSQINNTIFLEPGATYNEVGGTATVINVCGIQFDTSIAPACP